MVALISHTQSMAKHETKIESVEKSAYKAREKKDTHVRVGVRIELANCDVCTHSGVTHKKAYFLSALRIFACVTFEVMQYSCLCVCHYPHSAANYLMKRQIGHVF